MCIYFLSIIDIKQMSKKIIMPKNPVNHYSRLPNSDRVVKFIQRLQLQAKLTSKNTVRCCFMVASTIKDAFLTICFCFGGYSFINELNTQKISPQIISYFREELQEYNFNQQKSSFEIYQHNAKLFGEKYPFYHENIHQKISQQQALDCFKRIINNQLLHGIKIRILNFNSKEQYQENYKKYQRQNESSETKIVNGKSYLLIVKARDQEYNVGIIQQKFDMAAQDSFLFSEDKNLKQIDQQISIGLRQSFLIDNGVIIQKEQTQKKNPNRQKSQKAKSGSSKKRITTNMTKRNSQQSQKCCLII